MIREGINRENADGYAQQKQAQPLHGTSPVMREYSRLGAEITRIHTETDRLERRLSAMLLQSPEMAESDNVKSDPRIRLSEFANDIRSDGDRAAHAADRLNDLLVRLEFGEE